MAAADCITGRHDYALSSINSNTMVGLFLRKVYITELTRVSEELQSSSASASTIRS